MTKLNFQKNSSKIKQNEKLKDLSIRENKPNSFDTQKSELLVNPKKDKKIGGLLIKLSIGIGIIGVLGTIIILPNLLVQGCGGAVRLYEGKNAVGAINRSQQAYHFENNKFGSSFEDLGLTDYINQTDYYDVSMEHNSGVAYALATPTNPKKDDTRPYSGAIIVDEEGVNYQSIVCQANEVTTKPMPIKPIFDGSSLNCPENMTEVR